MKKLLVLLLVLISICLTGCQKEKEKISTIKITENNDITLAIKDGTLTSTGATLILNNNSDKTYTYSNDYGIEFKQNDNWYELKGELIVEVPILTINAHESKEIKIGWENSYGKLKKGTYRLIKSVGFNDKNFYIAEEFEIN